MVNEGRQPADGRLDEFDVFVSYTSRDLQWAQWLVEALETLDFSCRYQQRDFALGMNFVAAMHDNIVAATVVIAVLSPEYEASPYCKEEWTAAHKDPGTRLVPVRVADYRPTGILGTLDYVDLVGIDDGEARETILQALAGFERSGAGATGRRLGQPRYSFPGKLHAVPVAGAPLLGRDDLLGDLGNLLDKREGMVAIVPRTPDTVGAGCTALAADYVRSRADKYGTVCWVPSSPMELLPMEFWRLGRQLGLPPPARNRDGVVDAISRRAQRERVLIVFDDAPDRGKIAPWLPGDDVDCLVTSKSGSYRDRPLTLGLEPLTADQAIGALSFGNGNGSARALADLLGYAPRAIRLAGGYLRSVAEMDAAELAARLQAARDEGRDPEDELRQLAFLEVDGHAPDARWWLAVLGCGASRPVPMQGLTAPGGELNEALSRALEPSSRERAIDAITRLELGFQIGDSVVISKWVGTEARRRLPDDQRTSIGTVAVETFRLALRRVDRNDAEVGCQLACHLWSAIDKCGSDADVSTSLSARADLSRFLSSIGCHGLAESKVREGLDAPESERASCSARLEARRALSSAVDAAGRAEDAIVELELACSDAEGRERTSILIELGALHAGVEGGRDGATRAFQEAEAALAETHDLAQELDLLAARTRAHEQWHEDSIALELARSRVEQASDWAGDDDPRTITARIDRARLLRARGDAGAARDDLERAIAQLDDDRDEQMPDALAELAAVLAVDGDTDAALLALGRAGAIHERRSGPQSDEVRAVLRRTASLWEEKGDAVRAEAQRARAESRSIVESEWTLASSLAPFAEVLGRRGDCAMIIGPEVTNTLFGQRADIACNWAAEEYPLESYRLKDLPTVAEFMETMHEAVDVRNRLKEYLSKVLIERYAVGLPKSVARADPTQGDTLERVIRAVGATARVMDPLQDHAVLARLPVSVYVVAGASDLLADALRSVGKRPNVIVCNWRKDSELGATDRHAVPSIEEPIVLHIFGHLAQPGSVTLTETDYIRFVRRVSTDTIPLRVSTALVESTLMILGFRLHDWDFHMLFEGLINQPGSEKASAQPTIAVNVTLDDWADVPRAQEFIAKYFRRLSARVVDVVWESADDLIAHLAHIEC